MVENANKYDAIDTLAIDLSSAFLKDSELELLKEALVALKDNDDALSIFDAKSKAQTSHAADFSLGVCQCVTLLWYVAGS